jgi:hypothetical protein
VKTKDQNNLLHIPIIKFILVFHSMAKSIIFLVRYIVSHMNIALFVRITFCEDSAKSLKISRNKSIANKQVASDK